MPHKIQVVILFVSTFDHLFEFAECRFLEKHLFKRLAFPRWLVLYVYHSIKNRRDGKENSWRNSGQKAQTEDEEGAGSCAIHGSRVDWGA